MIEQNVLEFFRNKQCLVTGGTGLIGRKVVDLLADNGARVTSVSLDTLCLRPDVVYKFKDLRDINVCKEVMSCIEYVFHLVGIKGSVDVTAKNPATMFIPYLQFNTNVLEAARLANVKGLVYTSTVGAYASAPILKETTTLDGQPMDKFAGWAKRMGELQIQAYKNQYGLNTFIAVRPTNVYGEGDNFDPNNAMVIPSLIAKAVLSASNDMASKKGKISVWGDGTAIRDFAYSTDIAEGIILALYHHPDVPYLNLGTGESYSVMDVVNCLHDIYPFFDVDWDLTKPNGFPKRVMDCSLAKKLINYNPTTSLYDGLKNTVEWYCNHSSEGVDRKNYFVGKDNI